MHEPQLPRIQVSTDSRLSLGEYIQALNSTGLNWSYRQTIGLCTREETESDRGNYHRWVFSICIWCCLNEWMVVVFRIFKSIYLWGWWNLNHKLTRCDVYLISLTHSQIHTVTVNIYFFSRLMYHHIYSFPHVGMLSPILSWATSTQHYYAGRIPSSTWAVRIHSWRDGSGTSHAGTTHSRVPEEYQTTSLHSIEHRVIKHNNNWWHWWWRRWRRWLPSRI